jgi:hypothetical protein
MKKLLLSSSLICLSFIMYAQKAESKDEHAGHAHAVAPATTTAKLDEPKAAGEILVVNKDVHDFGKIPQGKPVHYIFEVTNKSTSPLKISNVQASCGCTTPEWDKDAPIPAGSSAKITVGYNAQAEGPFSKPVTITYNDGLTKVINIKGEVWKTPAESAPANSGLNEIKN